MGSSSVLSVPPLLVVLVPALCLPVPRHAPRLAPDTLLVREYRSVRGRFTATVGAGARGRYALKIITCHEQREIDQALREAEVYELLSHDNAIRIVDHDTQPSKKIPGATDVLLLFPAYRVSAAATRGLSSRRAAAPAAAMRPS